MKFLYLAFAAVILACAGGFIWLGLADVPVQQKEVVKEIPYQNLAE